MPRLVHLHASLDIEDMDRLLTRFYYGLIRDNFARFEDELEDLKVWQAALGMNADAYDHLGQDGSSAYRLHVVLALDGDGDEAPAAICGGAVGEYYPRSHCGLLTYIAVDPHWQRAGVGRALASRLLDVLHAEALRGTGGRDGEAAEQAFDTPARPVDPGSLLWVVSAAGCEAVFLETNADSVDAMRDVMVPAVRRNVLRRLGFRPLQLAYVQPALGPDKAKCRDLVLAVHEAYVRPEAPGGPPGPWTPAGPVRAFLQEFFRVLGCPADDADAVNLDRTLAAQDAVLVG